MEEESQITNVNFQLKTWGEKEQTKSKASRQNEIIAVRAPISKTERRKTIENSSETKS